MQVVSAPPPNATMIGGPIALRPTVNPSVSTTATSAAPVNHSIQLQIPPRAPPPSEEGN